MFIRIFRRMRINPPAFACFICISCSILIGIGVYELHLIRDEQGVYCKPPISPLQSNFNPPVYAVYGHDVDSGYLKHVFEMFDAFGFIRGSLESNSWDILWAHDYPFREIIMLKSLKPHQKVNHFPGTGFITNKLDLATTDIEYIPKAFRMPQQKEQLLSYISNNPEKMFVQKSNNHRGIEIKNLSTLNLTAGGTFIQEFVSNPLLVDGHKFDIGVYTIITSVEPLRVYIYNGDILFRFCPEKYHPFDSKNANKYVITDDYLPLWQVPSLKKFFVDYGYSMRESFNQYMKKMGKDYSKLWRNIENAIREVCLSKEPSIARLLRSYASKKNFFEMMRFDFAVDNDLNVFIMEANMSPNLSSAHFPPNRLIYLQVLFNLFSLVGLSNFQRKSNKNLEMKVSTKNLMVHPELCSNNKCASCLAPECQLCLQCLNEYTIQYLKDTYVEFNRRHDCKRIFPPTMTQMEANTSIGGAEDYSPDNQLLYNWFKGKCLLDPSWC